MKLNFIKINPSGNMTLFVLDKLSRNIHPSIANKLMTYESIHAEQVGFIEKTKDLYRVQMMGGEFCGNASRSFAAYMVYKNDPSIMETEKGFHVTFEVSGSKKPLTCEVRMEPKSNIFFSTVEMPLPIDSKEIQFTYKDKIIPLFRVDFQGISHFIVDSKLVHDKLDFFQTLKTTLKDEDLQAFGIMFYDKDNNFIDPLVYVRKTDSICFEKSCASGSAAIGVYLASSNSRDIHLELNQPGGSLRVYVDFKDKKIQKISLGGIIEIVAEGIVMV